jgi:hypothetical protein
MSERELRLCPNDCANRGRPRRPDLKRFPRDMRDLCILNVTRGLRAPVTGSTAKAGAARQIATWCESISGPPPARCVLFITCCLGPAVLHAKEQHPRLGVHPPLIRRESIPARAVDDVTPDAIDAAGHGPRHGDAGSTIDCSPAGAPHVSHTRDEDASHHNACRASGQSVPDLRPGR